MMTRTRARVSTWATVTAVVAVVLCVGLGSAISVNDNLRDLSFFRASGTWQQASSTKDVAMERVEVLVALRRDAQQLEALEEMFWAVSTPGNPLFGRHLTPEEVTEIVGASDEHIAIVSDWLLQSGAENVMTTIHKDYIRASFSVEDAEKTFHVKLVPFVRNPSLIHDRPHLLNNAILRSTDGTYRVPSRIAELIDFVKGIAEFPQIPAPRLQRDDYGYPGIDITPPIIKQQYNITVMGSSSESSHALAEFEQEFFYMEDVATFEETWDLPTIVPKLVGPDRPNTGDLGEATLDVEYIIGVASNIDTWVFYQSDFDLVEWGLNVSSHAGAPKVHSISYGSPESSYDLSLLTATNIEFQKLGVQGFSIFVASGDYGTGHSGIAWCGEFQPYFPASSPYITSVGGTFIDREGGLEQGVSFSGGGFSDTFGRPAYQDAAVSAYLNSANLPNSKYYNATGRGIPDVSALSTNFQVIIQNYTGPISGTSAACPTFAGIISLVNDRRYQAGKQSIGFINPIIYQNGSVGTDITEGNNKASFCPEGFPATVGWDAITGLGTPLLPNLIEMLVNV